jgi:hypothetical protein
MLACISTGLCGQVMAALNLLGGTPLMQGID